jgi:hypothetical protein
VSEVAYEVNIDLDAAVEAEYRAWLRDHVAGILALPGFIGARVFDVLDPPPAEDRVSICVHYRLHDEASLQAYFDQHAARLRAEGAARFGGRFRASRRVMRVAG